MKRCFDIGCTILDFVKRNYFSNGIAYFFWNFFARSSRDTGHEVLSDEWSENDRVLARGNSVNRVAVEVKGNEHHRHLTQLTVEPWGDQHLREIKKIRLRSICLHLPLAHLIGHMVDLSDGADNARRKIRGGHVLDGVSDHFAKNVGHPVDVVADSGNQPGDEHQVFPLRLLVTRDAHHITIATTVALQSKFESICPWLNWSCFSPARLHF